MSPLHAAAGRGNIDTVKYLVKNNASLEIKDKYLKTPLHYSIENNHLDVIEFLVEQGANINSKDIDFPILRI